jgi:hypothetical protein
MCRDILPAFVVAAMLGGCAYEPRVLPTDMAANERACTEIATTGDMYRECLLIGPAQTLAEMGGGSATATAAARD